MRRTEKPPTELIDEFQRIVKDAELQDILGLYHIDGGKEAAADWKFGSSTWHRNIGLRSIDCPASFPPCV